MPESVTDRPTKSHEYMFLLTKSAKYYFDQEAVKEKDHPDGRKQTVRLATDRFKAIGNTYQDNEHAYRDWETDRKSTRLNSSHITRSRMPSSA